MNIFMNIHMSIYLNTHMKIWTYRNLDDYLDEHLNSHLDNYFCEPSYERLNELIFLYLLFPFPERVSSKHFPGQDFPL